MNVAAKRQLYRTAPVDVHLSRTESLLLKTLVENGLITKELSGRMNIATKTAETHRANIHEKIRRITGLRSVNYIDLVLFAVTHDLIDMAEMSRKYHARESAGYFGA